MKIVGKNGVVTVQYGCKSVRPRLVGMIEMRADEFGESRAGQPSMLTCVNITQRIDQSISHVSGTIDNKKF